jgi:hypothetical protein
LVIPLIFGTVPTGRVIVKLDGGTLFVLGSKNVGAEKVNELLAAS